MTSLPPQPNRGGRLILRGGLANAGGFLIRFGARFGFLFIGARLFGAEALGAYVIALAMVELGVMVGGLGARWLVFQWIDEREPGRPPLHAIADAALLVSVGAAIIAAGVAAAAWLLPASLLAPGTALALLLLAPAIWLQALVELSLAATRWTEAVRYDVIGKSVIQPWVGIFAAFAAWLAGWEQAGLPFSYLAASIAALGYSLWGLSRCFSLSDAAGWHPSGERLAAMARHGTPTMLAEASDGLAGRFDLWLVGALLGEAPAGIYGLAKQIAIVVRQVRQSVDGLLVPLVARTVARAGEAAAGAAVATAARFVLVIPSPVLIVFAAVGAPLLAEFGEPFRAGATALLLLGLAEAVQSAFGMGDLIFAYRRPRAGLAVTLAALALAAILAPFLIERLGISGAAGAILAGQMLRAIARRLLLRRRFGVAVPLAPTAVLLAITAGGVALAQALHFWPGIALLAGLATFGVLVSAWHRMSGTPLLPHGFVDESP